MNSKLRGWRKNSRSKTVKGQFVFKMNSFPKSCHSQDRSVWCSWIHHKVSWWREVTSNFTNLHCPVLVHQKIGGLQITVYDRWTKIMKIIQPACLHPHKINSTRHIRILHSNRGNGNFASFHLNEQPISFVSLNRSESLLFLSSRELKKVLFLQLSDIESLRFDLPGNLKRRRFSWSNLTLP